MPKKNPIETALDAGAAEKLAAKKQDLELWETWKANPTTGNLNRLYRRFQPVYNQQLRQNKAPNVNEAGFDGKMKQQAIKAFATYDPKRSALRTHVQNSMKGLIRHNAKHQNYGFIPEEQVGFIGSIDRSIDALQEINGREPSHKEIADYANSNGFVTGKKKLTGRMVARVQGNRRRDVIASGMESDPTGFTTDRNRAILPLVRHELTPDEQTVFDHLYGHNGAVRINSTGQLAKKLGKSASQVSRLKSSIARKYKKHL